VASLKKPQLTTKQALALGATELHYYFNQIEWSAGNEKSFAFFKEFLYREKFFVPQVNAK
jgi:hypothetical protein